MASGGFPPEKKVARAPGTFRRTHSYPPPKAQREQKDPEYEQLLGLVKERIQELEHILQPTSDTSGLFNGWCSKTAGMWYPDIGKKAHAVPCCFLGKRDVEPYEEASGLDFFVSKTPGSAQRGDNAHRLLGRQLRVMNAELERKGEKTMFIISQLHYDNLLGLIRNKPEKRKQHFSTSFPKVFKNPSSYIDIDGIKKQLKARRGEVDLMILHEDKGIIFIQVKSVSKEIIVDAEDSTVSPSTPTTPIPRNKIEEKVTEAAEQLIKDVSLLGKVMGRSSHWKTQDTTSIVKQVIAVPNLTRQDLSDFGLQEKVKKEIIFLCKEDTMEETAESIEDAESEAKIDMFRNWWNQLPSLEKPLPVDLIKEIVGKYIGPLSTVLDQKPGNLTDRLRRFIDCVKLTDVLSALRLLTPTQKTILEKTTTGERRVYISGPPGSGKTILLILKAATFLGQSKEHRVVVVNMYRGAPGRAIGQHIFNTISKQESFKDRVYQLQVDVDRKEFIEKANAILVKAGVKKRGVAEDASTEPQQTEKGAETDIHVAQKKTDQKDGSRPAVSVKPGEKPCGEKKPASTDDRRRKEEETKSLTTGARSGKLDEHLDIKASGSTESTVGMKDVLFLVDEIYIESFWEEITEAFSGEFAKSEVWCAGLFSENPKGFAERALDFVLRCPPAVQNLLYHVDWDLERRKLYRRDAEMIQLATNGPISLCVRHEAHVFKEEDGPCRVIDCADCAVELADVLKGENITKTTTRKGRTQSGPPAPASRGRGESATTVAASTKLKVVLLLNIPRDKYTKAGLYIEATDEEYKKYMDYVESSKFIKTLKEQGIQVDVKAQLACKTLEEEEEGDGSDVTATWLYNFQGLEAGVVIFLPGDPARNPDTPAQERREIPAPGLKTVATAQAPEQTGNQTPSTKPPSQAAGLAGEDKPASTRSVSSTETRKEAENVKLRHRSQPPDVAGRTGAGGGAGGGRGGAGGGAGGGRGGACPYSLSQLLWKKADIARYSDWDKTNILVAGSRSLSLFILMVP